MSTVDEALIRAIVRDELKTQQIEQQFQAKKEPRSTSVWVSGTMMAKELKISIETLNARRRAGILKPRMHYRHKPGTQKYEYQRDRVLEALG
jgi:hypothetical protein